MIYEEYASQERKAGGGVPSKEKAFNDSREMALQQSAKAIGINIEALKAMIKGMQ